MTHEERWLEHYKCAVEYFKEHNDLEIPFLYKVEMENSSFAIGEWLSYQRQKYKRGLLSNEQIELLESINISWKTNKNKNRYLTENKKWFNMYKYAVKYFKEHGNLLIPANLVVYDENNNEVKLGGWIIRQRSNYINNKLSTERIEYLNKINMIWKVFDKERIKRYNDLTWLKYYKEVLAYYKKYGNINVRKDYKVISENNEILDLYSWLTVQYFEYEKSSLSTYQINLLKQIGFMSYIDQRVKKL